MDRLQRPIDQGKGADAVEIARKSLEDAARLPRLRAVRKQQVTADLVRRWAPCGGSGLTRPKANEFWRTTFAAWTAAGAPTGAHQPTSGAGCLVTPDASRMGRDTTASALEGP